MFSLQKMEHFLRRPVLKRFHSDRLGHYNFTLFPGETDGERS